MAGNGNFGYDKVIQFTNSGIQFRIRFHNIKLSNRKLCRTNTERMLMKSKVGFVDTEDKDQKEPIMGRIEDQSNGAWAF